MPTVLSARDRLDLVRKGIQDLQFQEMRLDEQYRDASVRGHNAAFRRLGQQIEDVKAKQEMLRARILALEQAVQTEDAKFFDELIAYIRRLPKADREKVVRELLAG